VSDTYCFDACALITFINNEEGADIVEDILDKAENGSAVIYMSFVNLVEVGYGYMREKTTEEYTAIWNQIDALPIHIIYTSSAEAVCNAIRYKAIYKKISTADSLGLAAAKEIGAAFVTSDHEELEPVSEHEPISFLWLPAHPKQRANPENNEQ
jgi:predicted nucleic acid-binding protein